MARQWFVRPETERLDLGDGVWVDVKHELSYGDLQQVASQSRTDLTTANLHLVAAYLVDWNLTDPQGQAVAVDTDGAKMAALRAMSNDGFSALDAALSTHIQAVQTAKKAGRPSGKRGSARTSGSAGR